MLTGQADHSLLQLQLTLADAALLQERTQSQRMRRLPWHLVTVSIAASELWGSKQAEAKTLADGNLSIDAKVHSRHAGCPAHIASTESEGYAMLVQARVLVGCTTTTPLREHTQALLNWVGQPASAVQPELVQLHLGSSPKPVSLLAAQSPPRYAGKHPTCRAPPQVPAHTFLENPPRLGRNTYLA